MVGNMNGDRYYDIDLRRDIRSHVNDISVRFKTPGDSGTLWMTDSPLTDDYMKVFLENGELKLQVSVNGVSTY